MNLIIDIGNSTAKYSTFDAEGNCVTQLEGRRDDAQPLQQLLGTGDITRAILSSVSETAEPLTSLLKTMNPTPLRLSESTPLPVKNGYGSPHTLGPDRIAAVVGARQLFPESHVLVIDMGTCITYDLLTADGIYRGGNIAPGMKMRFSAMHEHTARLPRAEYNGKWPGLMGCSTHEALTGGVMWGIRAEIELYLQFLDKRWIEMRTILTGGDSHIFYTELKKDYPRMTLDEQLVARGLNCILEYNDKI